MDIQVAYILDHQNLLPNHASGADQSSLLRATPRHSEFKTAVSRKNLAKWQFI